MLGAVRRVRDPVVSKNSKEARTKVSAITG